MCLFNEKFSTFSQKRDVASAVYQKLRSNGFKNVHITTGAFKTTERINALTRFERKKPQILVATDIVARGVDFKDVKFVVNFDVRVSQVGAPDFKVYAYRVGRSGRFGQHAVAFNLAASSIELNWHKQIAVHFGFELITTN